MNRPLATSFAHAATEHRRELHVHCYRMLGSFDDAEDVVQEAYLRAWRAGGEDLGGLDNARAWLYRVATNLCLDLIKAQKRRVGGVESHGSFRDLPWLQPYPDVLLDEASRGEAPDSAAVARETIELTFIAVIQLLPPSQRAALVMRDVLEWPVPDVAAVLELSTPAVNSLLQRARATVRQHLPTRHRDGWITRQVPSAERAVLDRFITAHENADSAATLDLIADDIRITMPPAPYLFQGRADVEMLMRRAGDTGDWRLVPVAANRQPAAACYLREPGAEHFRAFKLDVLRVTDFGISEITTFGASRFPGFGLPEVLDRTE